MTGVEYVWSDFEPDEGDEIPGKFILTIGTNGDYGIEEVAVIVHRTCNGRYPIDGELANKKREDARFIVDALNEKFQAMGG